MPIAHQKQLYKDYSKKYDKVQDLLQEMRTKSTHEEMKNIRYKEKTMMHTVKSELVKEWRAKYPRMTFDYIDKVAAEGTRQRWPES